MSLNYNRWRKLLLFCLGISVAAFFCMKYMEADFRVKNEKFTIMGLELFYPKERVMAILSDLDDRVRTILGYHLHFDFAFMAGIYPGITSLCMMAREKVSSPAVKKLFFFLASVQLLAWAADIRENLYLLEWLHRPVIGDEFGLYHFIVSSKWIIALSGFTCSVVLLLFKIKTKMNKTHFLI